MGKLDGKAATTYTVTFNLNYDGSTDTTQSVTSGNAVSEPEVPTRNGYTFAGWYTDTDCTVEYNFSGVVTKNITLYAKWIEVILTGLRTISSRVLQRPMRATTVSLIPKDSARAHT